MNKKILEYVPDLFMIYKIIWDNDDVLVPSGSGLVNHFNKHLGKNISGGHYTQFQKLYGIDAVEETRLLDLFAAEDIAGKLKPINGMQDLLNLLYLYGCINYVCTARPLVTYEEATRTWLQRYFPQSIDLKNLYMFEGSNEQHYKFDKYPIFEKLQGDIFIDDSFHNVQSIATQCKRDVLILFQRTPHNSHIRDGELPKNVIAILAENQAENILIEIIKYDHSKRNKFIDADARTFTD